MQNSLRIKGSNQTVSALYRIDSIHTMCVFQPETATGITRKGNRGICQPVRNNKLINEAGKAFEGLAPTVKTEDTETKNKRNKRKRNKAKAA